MTDYVSIRDLSVPAVIGVHDWEREVEQTLLFSVDMAADVRRAAATDDLADALDYSAVARTIAAPRQLPVGAIMALVGAPLFMVLLRGRSRQAR